MLKTRIEWCDSSWNPISGCYHECPYCFARGIANRFKGSDLVPDGVAPCKIMYLEERQKVTRKNGQVMSAAYPYGFTPTFHEYRLDDPIKKGFGKTVFVCSMADMFGDWIPDSWIEQIFDACNKAPNHRYLFLTKNPKRYLELATAGKLPENDNFWYGTTITDPDVKGFYSDSHHTFISIEPILKPFEKPSEPKGLSDLTDWAIIGAETGNRKDKVVPERSWIEPIVEEFGKRGKPVFMKDSLIPIWGEDIITQLPWED